jgi:hypothetical protein
MTAVEVWDAELAVLAVILDTLRLNEAAFAGQASLRIGKSIRSCLAKRNAEQSIERGPCRGAVAQNLDDRC